jgi:hypothetical protein
MRGEGIRLQTLIFFIFFNQLTPLFEFDSN